MSILNKDYLHYCSVGKGLTEYNVWNRMWEKWVNLATGLKLSIIANHSQKQRSSPSKEGVYVDPGPWLETMVKELPDPRFFFLPESYKPAANSNLHIMWAYSIIQIRKHILLLHLGTILHLNWNQTYQFINLLFCSIQPL